MPGEYWVGGGGAGGIYNPSPGGVACGGGACGDGASGPGWGWAGGAPAGLAKTLAVGGTEYQNARANCGGGGGGMNSSGSTSANIGGPGGNGGSGLCLIAYPT